LLFAAGRAAEQYRKAQEHKHHQQHQGDGERGLPGFAVKGAINDHARSWSETFDKTRMGEGECTEDGAISVLLAKISDFGLMCLPNGLIAIKFCGSSLTKYSIAPGPRDRQ
jgi:hypothetical protein